MRIVTRPPASRSRNVTLRTVICPGGDRSRGAPSLWDVLQRDLDAAPPRVGREMVAEGCDR